METSVTNTRGRKASCSCSTCDKCKARLRKQRSRGVTNPQGLSQGVTNQAVTKAADVTKELSQGRVTEEERDNSSEPAPWGETNS